MLISNLNRFGCQKIRHIFNAIGCYNFVTLSAETEKLKITNLLIDSLNCKCIHRIPAHYHQVYTPNIKSNSQVLLLKMAVAYFYDRRALSYEVFRWRIPCEPRD
jgi:hypothetical protein